MSEKMYTIKEAAWNIYEHSIVSLSRLLNSSECADEGKKQINKLTATMLKSHPEKRCAIISLFDSIGLQFPQG